MNNVPESDAVPISLILVGAGGFGREVLSYIRDVIAQKPGIHLKGFLDDNLEALSSFNCGLPLIGPIHGHIIQPEERFVMTIGDPSVRAKIILEMEARGAQFITIIHPTAFVAPTARIGKGCILAPFSSVGSDAKVGNHVVMTWYASLAHDTITESFAVLSPYSTANGSAVLEEGVFLGTHAVVNPMIRIGAWSRIASGSIVYRAVGPHRLALGNPAKDRPLLARKD
jgi:sugar O-acyltransferase (sialic acid O-acetyltransferase NeuD family)